MTLSSASTLAEIQDEYLDNADYDTSNSTTKAAAFIKAGRYLILKMPVQSGNGRHSMQLNVAGIEAQIQQARSWLAQKQAAAGGRVVHHSFENFRR